MTWNVISDGNGNFQLVPVGDPIPEGWVIEVVTANPDYLNQPAIRVISKYAMRQRFTFAEKVAIDTSTDGGVIVFRNDFNAAEEIDLDSQNLIDGLAYLESINLLASGRASQIRE